MGENHYFWWVISYYFTTCEWLNQNVPRPAQLHELQCSLMKTRGSIHQWPTSGETWIRVAGQYCLSREGHRSLRNLVCFKMEEAHFLMVNSLWKIMEDHGKFQIQWNLLFFQVLMNSSSGNNWWFISSFGGIFSEKKWMHRIDVRNYILLVPNSTNDASFIADLQDLFTRSAGHPDWKPHIPTQWYGRDRSHHGEGESSP